MARGKRQHYRVAEPMGMIDMDENSFDNFDAMDRSTELDEEINEFDGFLSSKGGSKLMMECMKKTKVGRFPSKSAKMKFLKDCMKKSAKKKKKTAFTKLKGRKFSKKKREKTIEKISKSKDVNKNLEPQKRLANPDLIKTPEIQTPPAPQGKSKVLLYGSIGVVLLVVGLYLFKR
jgi:hypothetical protein|tara:strand:- start:7885 stop:8409 length:525 start_codon:yes stop_codon:yes gene_type:complete